MGPFVKAFTGMISILGVFSAFTWYTSKETNSHPPSIKTAQTSQTPTARQVRAASGIATVAHAKVKSSAPLPKKVNPYPLPSLTHVRVIGIGGSIALGDKATNRNGYLQRAFHHFHDSYYNKAIYGANSTQLATLYKGEYASWLGQIHPQFVAVSWGLLNDVVPDTPLSKFNEYLHQEITTAIAHRANVLIVTPPVTEVSYAQYAKQEEMYDHDEVRYAKSLHNRHVYVFDLFNQMKKYLASHHESIQKYSADAHHPNNLGHELAANLLIQDLNQTFHPSSASK